MKALGLSLVALAVILAALAASDEAQATAQCQPTMPTAAACQGVSGVGTTVGGVASGRCFYFTTQSAAPACSTAGIITTGNQAWELDAGGCTTLYYHTVTNGASPPLAPNKLTLEVFVDDTTTLVKSYLNLGTPPSTGTSYTFCATSNGDSGSAARAGSVYLDLIAVKDNGLGPQNYNVRTNGAGSQDASFDTGFLRALTLLASVTNDANPSGAAYGAAGDETVTITATFTPPFGEANHETRRTFLADSATLLVGAAGATVEVDSGSLAQGYVIDQTFPSASGPYVGGLTILGNAYHGLKETRFAAAGHGAGITIFTDLNAYASATFAVNPDIRMDSDGTGGFASADETDRSYVGGTCTGALIELFNRGEMACTAWSLVNARGEYLTRAMTFTRHDTTPTQCSTYGSVAPTATVYTVSGSFSTGATCIAAADTTGTARHLVATNTDQAYTSGTIYRLSSLYIVEAHTQEPGAIGAEQTQFFVRSDGAGGDDTDTIGVYCHVAGVRDDIDIDTSGSAVTRSLIDPTPTTRATGTTDTGSDGWTPALSLLATTPLGDDWTAPCSVAFNGNTGNDVEPFTIDVDGGGGGDQFQADPLKVYAVYDETTGIIRSFISASFLDGTARTGASAAIFVDIWDHSVGQVVNDQNPVELGLGGYYHNYTPASAGIFTVRVNTTDPTSMDPIGVENGVLVRGSLEPVTEFETLTTTSGTEFFALLAVIVAAIVLWSRSTDFLVKIAMGIICFIPAIIWIWLTVNGGWGANGAFAVVAGGIGGYLMIRAGIDKFNEA